MRERGFSFARALTEVIMNSSSSSESSLANLVPVEGQAIEFVKVLNRRGYVSADELLVILSNQQLPAVDLNNVASFLAGYYAAESFDSEYDSQLYGEMSMSDPKGANAKTALGALLTLMQDRKITDLPNRIPPAAIAETSNGSAGDHSDEESQGEGDGAPSEEAPAEGSSEESSAEGSSASD